MKISLNSKTDKGNAAVTKRPRVSIVDDDESVRDAIKSLLKSMGLRADVFASAEEFLNSDYTHDTACLILDLRMPGMSGLELQHQLVDANCRIPIIFVTAHGDDEERKRALQFGAIDFLRKPFNEDALLAAVNVALKSGRDGDAT